MYTTVCSVQYLGIYDDSKTQRDCRAAVIAKNLLKIGLVVMMTTLSLTVAAKLLHNHSILDKKEMVSHLALQPDVSEIFSFAP